MKIKDITIVERKALERAGWQWAWVNSGKNGPKHEIFHSALRKPLERKGNACITVSRYLPYEVAKGVANVDSISMYKNEYYYGTSKSRRFSVEEEFDTIIEMLVTEKMNG